MCIDNPRGFETDSLTGRGLSVREIERDSGREMGEVREMDEKKNGMIDTERERMEE